MNMRQQMGKTAVELMELDERVVVVLAAISRDYFPDTERVLNLGICEQAMIGVAAGLALEGFIPVAHSIVPFLVERPFEQLKDDFCYQRLGGNFVSTGASYDYSTEGMTHHGPGDVQVLRSLPGMQIAVPGTPGEFDRLFRQAYANGSPTYYRLAERVNPHDYAVEFGKMEVVRRSEQSERPTVIAVGPMLGTVLEAVEGLDVTVLYCTTIAPFDGETLRRECQGSDIVVVEPYYEGVLVPDIMAALKDRAIRVEAIGVPHAVLSRYGEPEQHDEALGLTPGPIRERIMQFINR